MKISTLILLCCLLLVMSNSWAQNTIDLASKQDTTAFASDSTDLLIEKRIIWRRDRGSLPILNTHRFIDNSLVIDPFNKTSFRLRMGYGITPEIRRPDLDLGDTVIQRSSGQLLYGNLGFQFELKIRDWISMFLKAGGIAKVGSDAISLFSNGLNTASETTIGWKIRLFNNDNHYLSSMLAVSRSSASITSILEFASNIGMGDSARLTTKLSALRSRASIHYAVAIGEMIGLQVDGVVSGGDLIETGKTGFLYGASFAADLNLYPRTNTPLGFSLGYSFAHVPEFATGEFNQSPIGNFKIAYTGSRNFIISADITVLEAKYLLLETVEVKEINTNLKTFSLNVLVYFN